MSTAPRFAGIVMARLPRKRSHLAACVALGAGLALVIVAAWAHAGPAAAFDARQGSTSGGRVVRTETVVGVLAGPAGDASVAVSRIDDSVDGHALVVGVGAGAGLGSVLSVHAAAARALWADAPDAWSVSVGPEASMAGNRFGARFLHTRFDGGRSVHGVAGDFEHDLNARWAVRADASYAHGTDGSIARSFLGGASFKVVGPLVVLGEAGMAHDPYGVLGEGRGADAGPPGLVGGLLNGNGTGSGNTPAPPPSTALHPTAIVGLRCVVP
jgi:hypothetical protein